MTLVADVRFGLRLLVKSPAFTLSVALALGLGIGVNVMAFTIYNAALFKSLPFDRPEQVVHIHVRNTIAGWERWLQFEEFLDYRRDARTFVALAAYTGDSYTVTGDGGAPERVGGQLVTPNTFSLLGQRPLLGRDFRDGDGRPGTEAVAIIGYGLWQARYGGEAGVVGRTVALSGKPATIVGVMAPGMSFPFDSQIWTPVVDTVESRDSFMYRGGLQVVGRLRDGVSVRQAQTEMSELAARLADTTTIPGTEPAVLPYVEWDVKPRHKQLGQALIGVVAFVLLIACSNVANLLMARAVSRSREIALRIALGAGRMRLVRQLLVESLLLGALGGIVGLLIGRALIRAFVISIAPLGVPYWIDWSMDPTAFAYLVAVSVLSGVIFGLAPAMQMSRIDPIRGLRESSQQAGAGARGRSLIEALVVAEISLTIVLLVGAGLFIRSLMAMDAVNVGFRTDDVLTATVPLEERKYPRNEDREAFVERLTERLGTTRDVTAFTFTSDLPGEGAGRRFVKLPDRELADRNGTYPRVANVRIAPGYFRALGLTMARGREFAATDGGDGSTSVIVNQRFAAQYWPGENPIGKRLRIGNEPWATVVGVSPTIRQTTLHRDVEPLVYEPPRQGWPFWFTVIARTRHGADAAAQALRDAARDVDPDLSLIRLRTYAEFLDRVTLETRLLSEMFSIFALIGIALSAFGIYAVTSYATSRRAQEIGVRIALGATARDVVWLVLRSGLKQLAMAVPVGLAGAATVTRVLTGALFDVSPLDAPTFAAIPVMLFLVVVGACLVPARRATRQNPLDAIRSS